MQDDVQIAMDVRDLLKNLSAQDFQNLGLQQLAYVRPVEVDDKTAYAVHAADGSRLLMTDSIDDAAIVIQNNDLEPITLQ